MKRLLYTAFIISSLNAVAQEKGPYCSISVTLHHPTPDYSDYFTLYSYSLDQEVHHGAFHADSLDSTIMEISLLVGDSLVYHGGWIGSALCSTPDEVEDVDGVLTILEGELVPITTAKIISSSPDWDYSVSQDAVIRSSCLLEIKAVYAANPKSHFVRVSFVEPTPPVLSVPDDITKDIHMILTDNANTLFIEADENAILNATIYSLSGQLVQKATIEGQQNLDISSFPKGCYIVNVSDETGAEKRMKFVK
jgi:hypothetical protein